MNKLHVVLTLFVNNFVKEVATS